MNNAAAKNRKRDRIIMDMLVDVSRGEFNPAQEYINGGGDINATSDMEDERYADQTALNIVCQRIGYLPPDDAKIASHVRFALELIEKGADVNLADYAGRTPLLHASKTAGAFPIVKALIAKGADVNARVNDERSGDHNYTPLKNALLCMNPDIIDTVNILKESGATL
jgi:ankyrin repeat protein